MGDSDAPKHVQQLSDKINSVTFASNWNYILEHLTLFISITLKSSVKCNKMQFEFPKKVYIVYGVQKFQPRLCTDLKCQAPPPPHQQIL